jgi:TP901 family phage tail tape measure protein
MSREVTFKLNLKIDGKNVIRQLTVDMDELQNAIGEVKTKTAQVTDSFIRFNQTTELIQNVSGAISQASSTLGTLTEESRSFGGAMAAANTMAGKNGEEFANLKNRVSELGETIPVARNELANGLYQVISNGVPENNWISYLEKSAKASVGGIADLGETVKVTSTIIKNYELDWEDAGAIQDKIQLTAKNGVTSFGQLAQALPRVTSNAATLGVSIDELMATFSTLTGVSGNTAEVSTQLAAIFTALVKPSSEASEMAQQMGIQFDAAAIKAAGGLSQFLTSLDKSVKQYAKSSGMLEQEVYGKLFGSAESLRAITPLTNQLADKFRENVASMQNSAGTIDGAFGTMASTGSSTLQMLNNKLGEYTDIIQSSIGNVGPYLNCITQISLLGSSMSTLARSFYAVATSAKVSAAAVSLYNKAIAIALGVSTAPLAAMAAALGVLAVGYSNVKDRMEDTDREARALRETIADMKKKQDESVESIRKYLPVAQDATKSVKDRKDAIIKLKQLYPDYFKNLDIATAKQYNIEKAVNAANRAYRNQLVLIAKQAKAEYEKSKALYGKGPSGAMMVGSTPGLQTLMDKQELAEIEAKKKAWEEAEKAVKDYDKEMGKTSPTKNKPGGNNPPAKPKDTPVGKMSYQQVADAIEKTTNKLKAAAPGSKEAKQLNDYNKKLQARKKILEATYSSLNTNKSKGNKSEPKFYKDPKTSEQYEKNINYYQGKLTDKNTAEDQRLRKLIQLWKAKKAAIDAANLAAERPLKLDSVDAYEKDINVLQQMVKLSIAPDEGKKLQKQLDAETRELGMLKIKIGIETIPDIKVKKNEKVITQKIDDQLKDFLGKHSGKSIVDLSTMVKTDGFSKVMGDIKEGWGDIQGVGGGIQSITDALDGNKNAWQAISGVINGFISVAEGIQGIVQFVNMLTTATQAKSAATVTDTAVTSANTAVTTTNTTAKAGEAITNVTASGAKLPFPANIAAIAAGVAAVVAALAMISGAFADGGVVGGNSPSGDKLLARVNSGEMILNAAQQARLFAIADGTAAYGASAQIAANFAQGVALPSVSVQTDRLQGIMANGGGKQPQAVEWRLRGRDIVASIANETRSNRKRSNIRIK